MASTFDYILIIMARIWEVMVIETLTVLWDLGNRKDYSFHRKREEDRTFVAGAT